VPPGILDWASFPAVGIHGTIAPPSIYRFGTHGCIRLRWDDIAELFLRVIVGTPVKIIYQPVLLARLDDGRIFMEANFGDLWVGPKRLKDLQALASSSHVSDMIDAQRVRKTLERKDRVAHEVTRRVTIPILACGVSPDLEPALSH
jgi:L,D-transpeptidase ErfK/SrfK